MTNALTMLAEFDKYFQSMNRVPPEVRTSVPTAEWVALRDAVQAALAAPAQQRAQAVEWKDAAVRAVESVPPYRWVDGSDQSGCPCPAKVVATRSDYVAAIRSAPELTSSSVQHRKPLTETEMYKVDNDARAQFAESQRGGPRGQQITYWDSLTPWLIRAVERAHGITAAPKDQA